MPALHPPGSQPGVAHGTSVHRLNASVARGDTKKGFASLFCFLTLRGTTKRTAPFFMRTTARAYDTDHFLTSTSRRSAVQWAGGQMRYAVYTRGRGDGERPGVHVAG